MKKKARKSIRINKPVDRKHLDSNPGVPIDRLTILLRAFVERKPKKQTKTKKNFIPPEELLPSDWVLIFDTETTTDQSQRLRFGTYQLRYRGILREQGVFYGPEISKTEIAVISSVVDAMRSQAPGERISMMTRDEFVKGVLLKKAYAIGAVIVGFNLPYDLSRIPVAWGSARGEKMKGGFSFTLSERPDDPHLRIKHLNGHSAFIDFASTEAEIRNRNKGDVEGSKRPRVVERGFFVDLRTASKALLSEPHSLASLSKALRVKTPKIDRDDHGQELTEDYVRYGFSDTQTTWECFDELSSRYKSYGLNEVAFHKLYSEASLGKAYLQAMNVRPWREVQKEMPSKLVGHIMSAYFGGRSEVHLRREVAQVLYCDFLSMYPTVCTLMGLWRFVISNGISPHDDTAAVKALLRKIQPNDLLNPEIWKHLNVLVQALPDDDVFPVRAHYPVPEPFDNEETPAIGLNRLSRDKPLWFTLADCIASKILTGNAPRVVSAIRFEPREMQSELRPILIAGNPAYRIEPAVHDFYKSLIELRQSVKAKIPYASDEDRSSLNSDQMAIKILANATSYGIFVELNVKDLDKPERMICHGWRDLPWEVVSKKYEEPGRYFHPLVGTLITGAARLMLALAERQTLDQGLNWVFCDTDSLAIAKPDDLGHETFVKRALAVCDWFKPLNPYGEPGSERASILQVEKINYRSDGEASQEDVEPLYCLAISAKRYALFNLTEDGYPIIRKASGHGLGHLLAPYDDPNRPDRIDKIGVPAWEEDLWGEIIKATLDGHPDQVPLDYLPGFDRPAASRYAATSPGVLSRFRGYNEKCEPAARVWPFNFLLSLQAKSVLQSASEEPFSASGRRKMRRQPHPAAPFDKDVKKASARAFDTKTAEDIRQDWLVPLGKSLVRYHLHPEAKFWGADYDQRGFLARRRVFADAIVPIGKEADKLDDPDFVGGNDAEIHYDLSPEDRAGLVRVIKEAKKTHGLRNLSAAAKVSHHRVNAIVRGGATKDGVLVSVSSAARSLEQQKADQLTMETAALRRMKLMIAQRGRNAVAAELGVDPSNVSKLSRGRRRLTHIMQVKLKD